MRHLSALDVVDLLGAGGACLQEEGEIGPGRDVARPQLDEIGHEIGARGKPADAAVLAMRCSRARQ